MELIFFLSAAGVVYVYAGYPLLALLLGLMLDKRVRREAMEPDVTVLIAAYNEQDVISDTIRNKLDQDYPPERLDILVVSDDSTDGTDEVVRSFNNPRVKLHRQSPRAGKTRALNLGVKKARGEIIVFSDANSIYAKDAIRRLVSNFADPGVGYVTGKMIYVSPDGSLIGDGCSSYMQYENLLRSLENRLGSVVGVDGGIDAVHKSLYRPMRDEQLPDFVLPLSLVEQGYRVVYEPEAMLREPALKEAGDEYRMRVRVALRALWAMWDMRRLLGVSVNPLFAWQLWSHKVLRYFSFLFLAIIWLSNLLLWEKGPGYQFFFIFQNSAYLAALLHPILKKKNMSCRLFSLARYFALLNLASAHAFGKFLLGKKQTLWTPRKG